MGLARKPAFSRTSPFTFPTSAAFDNLVDPPLVHHIISGPIRKKAQVVLILRKSHREQIRPQIRRIAIPFAKHPSSPSSSSTHRDRSLPGAMRYRRVKNPPVRVLLADKEITPLVDMFIPSEAVPIAETMNVAGEWYWVPGDSSSGWCAEARVSWYTQTKWRSTTAD